MVRLPVECCRPDIPVLARVVPGLDHTLPAVFQVDGHPVEDGAAGYILIGTRGYGIEAHRTEHIPCRHLPAVFVAAQAVGLVGILFVHDPAHEILCFPWLSGKVVQIRHMVAGFVAVGILPDEPGDVALLPSRKACGGSEHLIQLVDKAVRPAKQCHHPGNILWNKEGILPGVGFGKHEVHLRRVKGCGPHAIHPATDKSRRRVEKVLVVLRPLQIGIMVGILPQCVRHHGDAPVVVGIFQCLRHRFPFHPGRDIAIFPVVFKPVVVLHAALLHGLEGLFRIIIAEPLHIRICDNGHGMVADHAPGFVGCQLPYRQQPALVVNVEHGVDKVSRAFLLDDGEQRVQGPEGVPERKNGIHLPLCAVNLHVVPPVTAVCIGIQVWCKECMV